MDILVGGNENGGGGYVQAEDAEDDHEMQVKDVGYPKRKAEDHAEYAGPEVTVSSTIRVMLCFMARGDYH